MALLRVLTVLGMLVVFCSVGSAAVADPVAGTTERTSVSSTGEQANGGDNGLRELSADGCVSVGESNSSNLVADDTNGVADVFVHNCSTGATVRVSVASDGTQADSISGEDYSVSDDGQSVVFLSNATNIAPPGEPAGNCGCAYVHDLATGTTEPVPIPRDSDDHTPLYSVSTVAISGDGHTVVMDTAAGLIVADLVSGTSRVLGVDGVLMTDTNTVTRDGREVIITTSQALDRSDTNHVGDAYVIDTADGSAELISVGPAGESIVGPDGSAYQASISGNGRYAVFSGAFAEGGLLRLGGWLRDREANTTSRVDTTPGGDAPNSNANGLSAADTCQVAYESSATNILPGDKNSDIPGASAGSDVYVWDCQSGLTVMASVNDRGHQGAGSNFAPFLTADGEHVGFVSDAPNLVIDDTNDVLDSFVRHLPEPGFAGLRGPVDAPPTVNTMRAGRGVPVKFSLGGFHGFDVFAAGSPTSSRVTCDGDAPTDEVEHTRNSAFGHLSYKAATDTYTYVWKTKPAWAANPCRRLTLSFADGTSQTAEFRFRP